MSNVQVEASILRTVFDAYDASKKVEQLLTEAERLMKTVDGATNADLPWNELQEVQSQMVQITEEYADAIKAYEQGEG